MNEDKLEIRSYHLSELRIADQMPNMPGNEGMTAPQCDGYAAVFNAPSEDLGGFREVIMPGAFAKTIQEADVRVLINHDPNLITGRNKSGTLTLKEDIHGLRISNTLPDTTYARDLLISMKRGDIDQMSFGFQVIRDRWVETNNGGPEPDIVRYVNEVRLLDVSFVTYPAYPQTSAFARSMAAEIRSKRAAPVQVGHPAVAPAAYDEQAFERMRRQIELALADI